MESASCDTVVSHNVAHLGGFTNLCHYIFVFKKVSKKRIYLDTASATPVSPHVLAVMMPYFSEVYGNASAIHQEGVQARSAIEDARSTLAKLLHVRPQGVVFTASGTESNNLCIAGIIEARKKEGTSYEDMEIITTRIEHPSVLAVCAHEKEKGVTVTYVDVDEDGRINLNALKEHLSQKTILVVCTYANSEIGVIQQVGTIARIIRTFENEQHTNIHVHVDAAQAPLWLPCALDVVGADSITLDAGKCNGPKGIGVLVFKHGVVLLPTVFGGDQEQGLRAGTENTAFIVGAVEALSLAQTSWEERSEKVQKMRDYFIQELCAIEGAMLNGSADNRIANNVNISIPGIDSEFAVITLDAKGVACSTKSACGGAKGDGSNVVRVLTKDQTRAFSTIRFTLHEAITLADINEVVTLLRLHVEAQRKMAQKLTIK